MACPGSSVCPFGRRIPGPDGAGWIASGGLEGWNWKVEIETMTAVGWDLWPKTDVDTRLGGSGCGVALFEREVSSIAGGVGMGWLGAGGIGIWVFGGSLSGSEVLVVIKGVCIADAIGWVNVRSGRWLGSITPGMV